jgi:predicted dehydrogenase
MKKLNLGMIGYGGIGRVHALAYRAIPFYYGLPADTVNLIGVSTSRPETAQKAAAEIGCDFWPADYHDLLARSDIDVVDVCTPNFAHEEVILAAAAAGKHIYCEKPLAMNLPQARRMVEAVALAGVNNQMTFNFRFIPAVTRARQLVEAGFLGRVFSFRGRYYRASYIDPNKPLSWRLQKDVSGSGALFDLGAHILDLLYYLLGDFGAVQATLETLIKERPIAPGASQKGPVDVDDLALLHLRMADGTLGLVEISRMGTGATNDMQVELFGEQGGHSFQPRQTPAGWRCTMCATPVIHWAVCVVSASWKPASVTRGPNRPIGRCPPALSALTPNVSTGFCRLCRPTGPPHPP